MTVKNYSKIISLIIFLIVPVPCDLLNIGFKYMEVTFFEAASEPLLLILSKSRSLKKYLALDNKLTLNQNTERLYTGIKLLLLHTCSVVIPCGYIKIFNVFSVLFWFKNCCNFLFGFRFHAGWGECMFFFFLHKQYRLIQFITGRQWEYSTIGRITQKMTYLPNLVQLSFP